MSQASAGGSGGPVVKDPDSRGTPEPDQSSSPGDTSARTGAGGRASALRARPWVAAGFLLPALLLLGALVVYPIGYSLWRSFFDAAGDSFVGLANYVAIFSDPDNLTSVQNTLIWVVVAPSLATVLGLIFAVLTDRVRFGTAFKLIIFMPMAISMLAAGIIFRLVYEQDPDRGVANAMWVGVHDTFNEASAWPGARPRPDTGLDGTKAGGFVTDAPATASGPADLPLVGVPPQDVAGAADAGGAEPSGGGVAGTVWLDFSPGGGGETGRIDPGEKGLAGIRVEAVKDGAVVASATTGEDGTYSLPPEARGANLRLPAANFAEPYNGIDWLGPTLVTPAIIGSYIWMWAGFAMVLIAAGLASVPREIMEAARVDGASEWQVFRKVTVPLLAPVLGVVFVTLMINVMKIFDLVYIIAPSAVQSDASVLALQLYLVSFGGGADQGLGSAFAVLLLLLVVPVMIINIRRLRRENRR
ncbi:carbohydrate ABC transporter permease [Streptomyces sp. TR06-5]|uniref:carbohydrate ABC transporter permease n=1 Tax=unclassified Streptomyces TaxID=2593676 RepID=UPI0039A39217